MTGKDHEEHHTIHRPKDRTLSHKHTNYSHNKYKYSQNSLDLPELIFL